MSSSVSYDAASWCEAHFTSEMPNSASFESEDRICVDMGIGHVVVTTPNEYAGPYKAVPSVNAQEFGTKGKSMAWDFTVSGIQVHEAPNDSGTTITIG